MKQIISEYLHRNPHLKNHLEWKENEDLTKYSTMRLQARGDLFLVNSLLGLKELVKFFFQNGLKYKTLGLGANQLLPLNSAIPFVKLQFPFAKEGLSPESPSYFLPASLSLSVLTSHAIKNSLAGWEVFTGIPATIGGAVFMNAGTNLGEIGSLVKKVWIVDCRGDEKVVDIVEGCFSYRHNHFCQEGDIIYQVEMIHRGFDPTIPDKIRQYLNLRQRTQPLQQKTCGCVFKNHPSNARAGQFIDLCMLKGWEYRGLRISPIHGNFFENIGGATYPDLIKFIEMVQEELYLQFGIKFDLEVII